MKKFTQVCLITSLILILVGGTICVIGKFSGGWRQVDEIGENGSWHKILSGIPNVYFGEYFADFDDCWDIEENGIEAENGYTKIEADAEDITELKISIGGAALYIKESEDRSFGVKKEGIGKYQYYESNGVLYLEGNKKNVIKNNEKIYLYIPAGMNFERVTIEVGGGLVEAGELNADVIDVEAGAGMITSDKINCRSLTVDIGAGKATLKGIEAEEMDMSVGVGHVYTKGNITKKIEVDCEMGAVEMVLAGAEKDYNYEVNSEAGGITIGGRIYNSLVEDTYIDNDAPRECILDCAMGSIQLSFDK